MRTVKGLLVLAMIVGGFTAGWFAKVPTAPPGPAEKAREALAELLRYRGTGARGARVAMDLTYRIVPGGEDVVPDLAEAIGNAAPWKYDQDLFAIDVRTGYVSQFRDRHVALLETTHRIGGEAALAALMDAAENTAHAYDRIAATAFVAQRGDRPEVRDFLTARLLRLVRDGRDDIELIWTLRATRDRLNASAFDRLGAALSAPWLQNAADDLAETLVSVDRDRATRLFLKIVGAAAAPRRPRVTCAKALARLPDQHQEAAALLARDGDPVLLAEFLKSMKSGRYDEIARHQNALASTDPAVRRMYNEERVAHIEAQLDLIGEIAAVIGPERAARIELPFIIGQFQEALESGRRAVEVARRMEER